MKKNYFILILISINILAISCKKIINPPTDEVKTVKIGTQIWSSENHNISGKVLFSLEECKAIIPPIGFRLPTKVDWGTLVTFTGYSGKWFENTSIINSIKLNLTSMEGDFVHIKSLLSTDKWDNLNAIGTNTTGFNIKPRADNITSIGADYYILDPNYAYIQFYGTGFSLEVYEKNPFTLVKAYLDSSLPAKYFIRFIKI